MQLAVEPVKLESGGLPVQGLAGEVAASKQVRETLQTNAGLNWLP